MDMSICADCGYPFYLARQAAWALAIFFFPVGAMVLRKRRRGTTGLLRGVLNLVTILGIALAPLAILGAVALAVEMLEVPAAIAEFIGIDDLRDIATGAAALLCLGLAIRLLIPRDRLVTLRLTG